MQVRVVHQSLIPGMQYGQKADVRPEMVAVRRDGQQCFGHGAKEHAVNQARILKRQCGQFLRQGENDVAVGDRQKLGRPCRQPLIARCGLALRTMSIPARVVRDGLMRAVIALLQMSAKRGGAACADISECSSLLGRKCMAPSLEKLLFVLAKDIGDFQPMAGHCCWGSSFI